MDDALIEILFLVFFVVIPIILEVAKKKKKNLELGEEKTVGTILEELEEAAGVPEPEPVYEQVDRKSVV